MSENIKKMLFEDSELRKIADFRSLGREFAMQFLFQSDIGGDAPTDVILKYFWKQLSAAGCFIENSKFRKAADFAEKIIYGAYEHRVEIDAKMVEFSKNWAIDRMGAVDRNVIRIAIYEMLFDESVPPVVSINEAVDLVKHYGGDDSGSFINGILNGVKNSITRSAREAVKKK